MNPLEFINNPESFFKQCQQPTNTQTSQSTDPIEYLKVPELDSGTGISVTVTKF
jgi:sortase (surface protein transpeptidase)